MVNEVEDKLYQISDLFMDSEIDEASIEAAVEQLLRAFGDDP
jgi:hypothetical protein